MGINAEILERQLAEQVSLEEQLYGLLQEQITSIHQKEFIDAKIALMNTAETLEQHFTALNALLDTFEREAHVRQAMSCEEKNGHGTVARAQKRERLSRTLSDDYSMLNHITMSNTLLHTTGLALESQEVAALALRHLQNLAPLVVKLGELLPEIVTIELQQDSPGVDLLIAKKALRNTQEAWRKVT